MMQSRLFIAAVLFVATFIIFALIMLKIALIKMQQKIAKKIELMDKCNIEIIKGSYNVRDLSSLNNNAIKSEHNKIDFFINMTHDLKTPLSVILGSLQLIERKKMSVKEDFEKIENLLKIVRLNSYRLLKTINNMLDAARSDSGCLEVNTVKCNIADLVKDLVQSTSPFAEEKGISLEFDPGPGEILTDIDVGKFEKIILNLLSNAIKFTNNGGKVCVHISDENGIISLSVKDNGPGIPESRHSEIFERFRQAGDSLDKRFEGSGIGLSIVKSFVELHGGSIRVVSKENEGAEFIVQLPKTQINHKEASASSGVPDAKHIAHIAAIELSDIRVN